MTIELQYTDDNKGVVFCAVGRVTGKEILENQGRIYNDDRFPGLKYWIVDRSKCTEYTLTANDIIKIAESDNEAAKINPNILMALVAESNFQFGMSRMYEGHINEDGFKTMVFGTMDEARDWIEEELSKKD